MCLSLKWPIYGRKLKERLPGLASVTFLLLTAAAVLYIFPAVDVYLRPKCLSRALAAGASVTSQRWIKSRVKLPLKEMNK